MIGVHVSTNRLTFPVSEEQAVCAERKEKKSAVICVICGF
jgi:hypothetical protein